jgi:hypothetical protein
MTIDEKTEIFITSCKPCIFAQWQDGVQLDTCDLGRLEKYIQQGRTQSHPEGYHTITTVCNACRGETWANHNVGRNLISKVEEEIQVETTFILLSVDEDATKIVNLLPELITKCVNQIQVKPKQILVVIKNKDVNYNYVLNILNDLCVDVEFKLIKVLEESADRLRCLDLGVQKCTSRYYAVFDLRSNIPKNFIQTLNNLINIDLKTISMIKPICGISGMVVQTFLHKIFGGNKEAPIYEKIEEAAKDQARIEYIYDWEKLWTTYPK